MPNTADQSGTAESCLEFLDFPANLAEQLEIKESPFLELVDATQQLHYIHEYLKIHFKCRSVIIEKDYIDRDHIEDHSAFYSTSLKDYSNRCRRLHFFRCSKEAVQRDFQQIRAIGWESGPQKQRDRSNKFSREQYLGFSVIKPLHGSPLGRTVLLALSGQSQDGGLRDLACTTDYTVHLAGVSLTVKGLAFQQQDVGVSACATTAIWCSLQKIRDFEAISWATPSKITNLAVRHTLPFGRAMPSEGLSTDQMCQAIQALGLAPSLSRVSSPEQGLSHLHAAVLSGFAPIVIMEMEYRDSNLCHAVTVVGMKLADKPQFPISEERPYQDSSSNLMALYVHDDRKGPYVRADLSIKGGELIAEVKCYPHTGKRKVERWKITHLLTPFHPKIRLSFDDLRALSIECADRVQAGRVAETGIIPTKVSRIIFRHWIVRGHEYVNRSLSEEKVFPPNLIEQICQRKTFSRYVGVVRLEGERPYIDIVFDTTSTMRNLNCLAVITHYECPPELTYAADVLSQDIGAQFFQCS